MCGAVADVEEFATVEFGLLNGLAVTFSLVETTPPTREIQPSIMAYVLTHSGPLEASRGRHPSGGGLSIIPMGASTESWPR